MKLLILSDLHLEHHPFNAEHGDFDAVVLAGDIHAPGSKAVAWAAAEPAFSGKPVLYVPGNHEFYGRVMGDELALMREMAQGTNVRVLSDDAAVLAPPGSNESQGIRVLGMTLWTDFKLPILYPDGSWQSNDVLHALDAGCSMADFGRIRIKRPEPGYSGTRTLRPIDTVQMHMASRRWLKDQLKQPWEGKTLAISHHGPNAGSVADRYKRDRLTPGFTSNLPMDCLKGVDVWIHGHTHDSFDYMIEDQARNISCRVIANPRGYPLRNGRIENAAHQPNFIVEI